METGALLRDGGGIIFSNQMADVSKRSPDRRWSDSGATPPQLARLGWEMMKRLSREQLLKFNACSKPLGNFGFLSFGSRADCHRSWTRAWTRAWTQAACGAHRRDAFRPLGYNSR